MRKFHIYRQNALRFIFAFGAILFFNKCENLIVTETKEFPPKTTIDRLSKLSEIQKQIFTTNCALSGCHAGTPLQANLNLTSGNAFSNLVNVTSLLNPNFKRVVPGNSEQSFIIKMLRNTGEGTSIMPPTGKISDNLIDSIAVWIDNGAKNN